MAKKSERIEAENQAFKKQDGIIKCLSCGRAAASLTETGLACRGCGYAWTFETEAQSVGYITAVLRRPVITPPVVAVTIVEPEPTAPVVEPTPVKTVKGKG